METLSTILHVLLYIAGILGLLFTIYIIIAVAIDSLTENKRKEKAKQEAIKSINEVIDILAKLDINEEKPKNKATKKKKEEEK